MAKNVFSDSSYGLNGAITPSSITTNEITTGGIIIPGSEKGDILFIGDTSGTVDGLNVGTTGDVMISNGTIPEWTNAISINTLTCNDILINSTVQGDLLQAYGSPPYLDRVPIGTQNQILTVGSTSNAIWQGLQTIINNDNPITIPNLVISNNITYNTGSTLNGNMKVVNNLVTIDSETVGVFGGFYIASVNATGSTPYTTFSNYFTNGRSYKIEYSSLVAIYNATGNFTVNQYANIASSNRLLTYTTTTSSTLNCPQCCCAIVVYTHTQSTGTYTGFIAGSTSPGSGVTGDASIAQTSLIITPL